MRHRGPVAPSIFKRHPLTGEPIEPVGFVCGKPVWPVMGGAPDGDGEDDDSDDGDDDSSGDDADDKRKTDDKDDESDGDVVTREEFDALLKRMKNADKRADTAENKLKQYEDKDKDESTKATERAAELEKQVNTLQSEVKTLRLQNAFLTANTQKWHDPDVALDLAQSKGYIDDDIVDEDGKVDRKALKKALERLAKEKPFLVDTSKGKKKDSEDDDADDRDDDKNSNPPSGEPAGGRSKNGKDDEAARRARRQRFPVLNR